MPLSPSVPTFALEALPEQPSEQPFAVLADRRPCVRMDSECVRHLHLAHQDLVQVNRSARVEAAGITSSAWLAKLDREQRVSMKLIVCA